MHKNIFFTCSCCLLYLPCNTIKTYFETMSSTPNVRRFFMFISFLVVVIVVVVLWVQFVFQ